MLRESWDRIPALHMLSDISRRPTSRLGPPLSGAGGGCDAITLVEREVLELPPCPAVRSGGLLRDAAFAVDTTRACGARSGSAWPTLMPAVCLVWSDHGRQPGQSVATMVEATIPQTNYQYGY